MIYTDRIQHFCVVVETGSLAKAGSVLALTPGSLSRSLQKLKDEVGFELFFIEGRKLQLTDQGKSFYEMAQRCLKQYSDGLATIKNRALVQREEIRIGTFEIFSTHFITPVLTSEFQNENAVISELVPGEIEHAIQKGEVDFGITHAPVTLSGVEHLKIGEVAMGIYSKPGSFEGLETKDIPFAIPLTRMERNALGLMSLDGWDQRVPRSIRYRVHLLETALQLAKRGACAVYIPRFFEGLMDGKLVSMKRPTALKNSTMNVYLVKKTSMDEGRVAKKLTKAIRLLLKT